MAERTAFYTTPAERATLIAEAAANGERTIHDDFNVGPNSENRLTFEAPGPPPAPTAREVELAALKGRMVAVPTPVEIARYLVLRDRLDA